METIERVSVLEARDYALLAAEAASDKKAIDLVVLEVGPMLVITDFFVIATGSSDRQVHAIADGIERRLREAGLRAIGHEGEREAKWILIDFGEIVVHVFQPEEREFYRLEKLWSDVEHLALPDPAAEPVAEPTAEVVAAIAEPADS